MAATGWVAFVDRARWEASWNLVAALLVDKRPEAAPRLGDAGMASALLSAEYTLCGARQREVLVAPALCPPDAAGSCRGIQCPFAVLRASGVVPGGDNPYARAFLYHLGGLRPAAGFPPGTELVLGDRLWADLRRLSDESGELEWPALVSARPACYVCQKTFPRGTRLCPTCQSDLDRQDAWDREAHGAPLRKLLFLAWEETWSELTTDLQRLVALLLRVRFRGFAFGSLPGGPSHVYLPSEAATICQHLDRVTVPEEVRNFGFQLRAWLWSAASNQRALVVAG